MRLIKSVDVNEMLGKTFVRIDLWEDVIRFVLDNRYAYQMWHVEDCCERVTLEDVTGDLQDLVGAPLLMAEVVTNDNENPPEVTVPKDAYQQDEFTWTWTFYKFATRNGYVTLRWYGESNGYYSQEVDLHLVEL